MHRSVAGRAVTLAERLVQKNVGPIHRASGAGSEISRTAQLPQKQISAVT